MSQHICIVGATGGIGHAMVNQLSARSDVAKIYALSRRATVWDNANVTAGQIDITDEGSVKEAAAQIDAKLDMVIVTTGLLHDGGAIQPEKSLRQLTAQNMLRVLAVNTVGPALVGRYLVPLLHKDRRATFAALSARVGSISDNRLGGWHSYRASKAALNMVLKTMAIELRRTHPQAIVTGLHPGTVDTGLSQPFQRNVPEGKLFDAQRAAKQLLEVIESLGPEHSGEVFDWAGERVPE